MAADREPVTVVAPADFYLSLILSEQKDDHGRTVALFGSLENATDVVEPAEADRMAVRFEEILGENIADYPGAG
ncbi:hypothetical protein AB0H42_00375 [Nocardia sp. NPDC050799]|uniref:hypothetical protein n=1 Tax=Nocardia sp. NPDC050799 TaxID=3154842 RepID=UPI0033E77501